MKDVGCADQGFIVNSVLKYENKLSSIYDHSFVDEVQDLGVLELKLIRKITKIGENDLFLVGDRAQSILPKKSNLILSGINIIL